MPTIREVAKECGVSPMTVSFVLNNKAGQVSEETRERVLRAVRTMGYRPRAVTDTPELRKMVSFGLLAGVNGDSLMSPGYYGAILNGILVHADRLGHNVTLFTNSLFHQDAHQSLRIYCDGRCEGLIVIAPNVGSPLVKAISERGFPLVSVGSSGDVPRIPSVDVDNVAGAFRVTSNLIERGHRRIAFLPGPDFVRSTFQRGQGYRKAMATHGLPPCIPEGANDGRDGCLARLRTLDLMGLPCDRRPTAIFGWNDDLALEAVTAIHSLGLRVPQDVSVVGFDDGPGAQTSEPPLTTIRQPYRDISLRALEVVLAQIRGEDMSREEHLIAGELVERDSVGPPPHPFPIPECPLSLDS